MVVLRIRSMVFTHVRSYLLRTSSVKYKICPGDAMDASLPTGKELRPQNAECMNSRLSGSESLSNRGGSSDGYGIKVPMA